MNFIKGPELVKTVIVAIASVAALVSFLITHNHNNPVEKAAESVIEYELNLPSGTLDFEEKSK